MFKGDSEFYIFLKHILFKSINIIMKTFYTITKAAACILCLCLLFSACSKLEKPESDPTPPILKWNVHFLDTKTDTEVLGSGKTIYVKKDSKLKITLTAEDEDGGVQKITFGGGFTFNCTKGTVGQNSTGTLETDVQNLYPDTDNHVLPSIFLIKDIKMEFTCQPEYTLTEGSYNLTGSAENYFGGSINSTLKITTE